MSLPGRTKRWVFVFGSNLSGRHGKGAARDAWLYHGAIRGRAVGIQGDAYAIPTKTADVKSALPLERIRFFVNEFIDFARSHPNDDFQVTRIGCGYAGYKDNDIAPMFTDAPNNCHLPEEWKPIVATAKEQKSNEPLLPEQDDE